MQMNKQVLLDTVEQSPKAVAIHDKAAWMSIFAKYHAVEDPVGSKPHFGGLYDSVSGERGNGALDRFYDTFIAPNEIEFELQQDIVCGQHVVRDLTVHIQMSESLKASVPMHLLYELVQEGEQENWKIQRLAAHWELMPMMAQIFNKGINCLPVLFSLTLRMIKFQKLSGILGFCKAAFTIGSDGKRSVDKFIAAINNHNKKDVEDLFWDISDRDTFIFCEENMLIAEWLKQDVKILKFTKILVAGNFVSVSMSININNEIKIGVAFFEFNSINKKIRSLKIYA
jgi:hypothetical protein